ncbi:uncharacterized protein LOC118414563 [Branchiostoma floridae]|uniref:Uncharacterized protein LOC118414563 n=1 Tax=Branchiostoma floridae TaxID=7739 RepID=A0A9J7L349_BRAFL|nr:uncharacterized protein LOC118414563 [Branchiostoma floridae]
MDTVGIDLQFSCSRCGHARRFPTLGALQEHMQQCVGYGAQMFPSGKDQSVIPASPRRPGSGMSFLSPVYEQYSKEALELERQLILAKEAERQNRMKRGSPRGFDRYGDFTNLYASFPPARSSVRFEDETWDSDDHYDNLVQSDHFPSMKQKWMPLPDRSILRDYERGHTDKRVKHHEPVLFGNNRSSVLPQSSRGLLSAKEPRLTANESQVLHQMQEDLKRKDSLLEKASEELQKMTLERRKLQSDLSEMKKQMDGNVEAVTSLKEALQKKESELEHSKRSTDQMEDFIQTATQQETEAKDKLRNFIEALTSRTERAEKEVEFYRSQSSLVSLNSAVSCTTSLCTKCKKRQARMSAPLGMLQRSASACSIQHPSDMDTSRRPSVSHHQRSSSVDPVQLNGGLSDLVKQARVLHSSQGKGSPNQPSTSPRGSNDSGLGDSGNGSSQSGTYATVSPPAPQYYDNDLQHPQGHGMEVPYNRALSPEEIDDLQAQGVIFPDNTPQNQRRSHTLNNGYLSNSYPMSSPSTGRRGMASENGYHSNRNGLPNATPPTRRRTASYSNEERYPTNDMAYPVTTPPTGRRQTPHSGYHSNLTTPTATPLNARRMQNSPSGYHGNGISPNATPNMARRNPYGNGYYGNSSGFPSPQSTPNPVRRPQFTDEDSYFEDSCQDDNSFHDNSDNYDPNRQEVRNHVNNPRQRNNRNPPQQQQYHPSAMPSQTPVGYPQNRSKRPSMERFGGSFDDETLTETGSITTVTTESAFDDDDMFMSRRSSRKRSRKRQQAELVRRRQDALTLAFSYLDTKSLCACSMVCREWTLISRQPALWRQVHLERARVGSKFLQTIARWCTELQVLTLQNLRPRKRRDGENKKEYFHKTRGSLEPGLERLLSATKQNLLSLRISNCGNVLTDRALWLASCHCRLVRDVMYKSESDPVGQEVIWALGAGCREITSLSLAPMFPCQQPQRFNNRCLQMIGQCWPMMQQLTVGGVGITEKGLSTIASNCPRLQVLELDHMLEITEAFAVEMCRNGLKGLRVLEFSFTPVTPQALLHFNSSCPNLRAINIHISISDYFEDVENEDVQELYKDVVIKLKQLKKRPGFAGLLHIKSDY